MHRDQLQSERRAFLRVVTSQSNALDEALKGVEGAKKDAAKLKSKVGKEGRNMKVGKPKVALGTLPPPSMYQLAYEAPKVDHAPQHTIVGLAMSLEPATPNTPKEPVFNVYSRAGNVPPTPSYPSSPGQASYDPTHTDTKNEGQQSPNEQSKSQKNESNARPKPVYQDQNSEKPKPEFPHSQYQYPEPEVT